MRVLSDRLCPFLPRGLHAYKVADQSADNQTNQSDPDIILLHCGPPCLSEDLTKREKSSNRIFGVSRTKPDWTGIGVPQQSNLRLPIEATGDQTMPQ